MLTLSTPSYDKDSRIKKISDLLEEQRYHELQPQANKMVGMQSVEFTNKHPLISTSSNKLNKHGHTLSFAYKASYSKAIL